MREKITFIAAAGVFLAFAGLTPDDVRPANRAAPEAASSTLPVDTATPAASASAAPLPAPAIGLVSPVAAAVDGALSQLSGHVVRQSHPDALRLALQAYYNYRQANPSDVRKPTFYFVDFGLDARTPRGYVFDMERMRVIEGPFTVAHGRGSVSGGSMLPTRFLNTNGSNATSLGLYLAQETYNFRGKSGGRAYRSIGLRLKGLSGRFNSAARARGIVVHGAPYVTSQKAGRSEGCPAMQPELAERLIPQIANGGLVFLFSPNDSRWMQEDPWAAVDLGTLASAD